MSLWPSHHKPPACAGCPRAVHSRGFVPGDGPLPSRLIVVGEQPGENEIIEGKPFIGKSGWVLQDGLGGKEGRAHVYVTNVRKCLGSKGESDAVREASIAHCAAAYLQIELDAAQPEMVLAIGADAAHVLGGRGDVSVVSGSVYERAEVDAMRNEAEPPPF